MRIGRLIHCNATDRRFCLMLGLKSVSIFRSTIRKYREEKPPSSFYSYEISSKVQLLLYFEVLLYLIIDNC